MPKGRLHFPLGGKSTDLAFGDQPAGTTRETENCRALDPLTGRARGGQRSGSREYPDGAVVSGKKVQALHSINYDRPKIRYTANGTNEITVSWSKLTASLDEAPDVDTDRQGNVYVLDASGIIVKFNADGEELKTIILPTDDDALVLHRLVVDANDEVYAAAAAADGDSGSKLWKFRLLNDENQTYQLHWTLDLPGSIVNFFVRLNTLLVAQDHVEGASFSTFSSYSFLDTGTPLKNFQRACPTPVHGLHIDRHGSNFTCHPSNATRGVAPDSEGFIPSIGADVTTGLFISYTLHDIGIDDAGDDTGTDTSKRARWRIHSELLSDRLEGYAQGQEVVLWPDQRFVLTQDTTPEGGQQPGILTNPDEYITVDDDLPRRQAKKFTEGQPRQGPQFLETGAFRISSVFFRGDSDNGTAYPGDVLRSFINHDGVFKSDEGDTSAPDADGKNLTQKSLIPGHSVGTTAGEGWGNSWLTCQAWRVHRLNEIGCMWTMNGSPTKYALLSNAEVTSQGTVIPRPGWIAFLSNKMIDGDSHPINGMPGFRGVSGAIDHTGVDTTGMAIVTIGHNGWNYANEAAPSPGYAGRSFLRLNGKAVARWTMTEIASFGPTSGVVIGNPHREALPNPGADMFLNDGSIPFMVKPYFGHLVKWKVLLGDTADTDGDIGNDVTIDAPYGSLSALPPHVGQNSGSVDPGGWFPTLAFTHSTTEVEQIEGGIAHECAIPQLLPLDDGNGADGEGLWFGHPFSSAAKYPVGAGGDVDEIDAATRAIRSTRPILAKWGGNGGGLRWALNGSGLGHAVTTEDTLTSASAGRGVLTVGEKDASDDENPQDTSGHTGRTYVNAHMQRVVDLGNSYSQEDGIGGGGANDDGAWAYISAAATPTYRYQKLLVDGDGDVYWARGNAQALTRHRESDGAQVWIYRIGETADDFVRSIAFDPNLPTYDKTFKTPQHLYVASIGGQSGSTPASDLPTITKLQIVREAQVIGEDASPRSTRRLAVSDGTLKLIEAGKVPVTIEAAFDKTAPFVSMATLFSRVYMTDGRTYKVYNPKDNALAAFVSKDAGELPRHGRLMTAWDGRLVIARTSDDDHNWHMSKKGNAQAWDQFPLNFTALDAVSGDSNRGPGVNPDIINALIPWSDDLLLMGGDSTIHRMTGNPLSDNGHLDLVSTQTGIAFGSPWTKDPEDILYFFGSRGGVYAYVPGQRPVSISEGSIHRELEDVSLGFYRIGMSWDYRAKGLHVFQLPYGEGGIEVPGWFWEKKTASWWPDSFPSGKQPTAVAVFDGDLPDDRVVAYGSEDGKVRYFSETAADDDGERIDSSVLLGPIAAQPGERLRFSMFQVALASDQGPCDYEWYVTDTPDFLGEPVLTGSLSPGMNPVDSITATGGYVFLRLRNSQASRWAYESATVNVADGGRMLVLR